MSTKNKQRKMNEDDSDDSYDTDSSGDDNEAYAGNEVILQSNHLLISTLAKFIRSVPPPPFDWRRVHFFFYFIKNEL